jgi:hypothetical protein
VLLYLFFVKRLSPKITIAPEPTGRAGQGAANGRENPVG